MARGVASGHPLMQRHGGPSPQGKPWKVENESRSLVERLERDLEKAVTRAKQTASDAGLVIRTIVIDGNNLCITSDSRFVGLEVL